MLEGLIGLAIFLTIAFMRVPLAFSMALVGFAGFAYKTNLPAASSMIAQVFYETGFQYTLSVIPLFVVMGNFIVRARITEELFDAAYAFFGHLKGGLAISTLAACAGFGAVCGSSVATSATFTKVAFSPMIRFSYRGGFAAATIAAGGTLGIMIPPSVIMILYGVMTENNIGKLFAAGIVPGLVALTLMCMTVVLIGWLKPEECPAGERAAWGARFRALRSVWPAVVLFLVVMGGIYGGVFTANEGAAIGAVGAVAFALWRGCRTWGDMRDVLVESGRTTVMIFMLLIGALMFANFINLTTLPQDLVAFVTHYGVSPTIVMLLIMAIYIVLGVAMEEVSMILLTLPIFYPLVVKLGFDPIWFGVVIVSVVMIGMVSPPVGLNLFVVRALLPSIKTSDLLKSVTPYAIALCVLPLILLLFPQLATWLPQFVK